MLIRVTFRSKVDGSATIIIAEGLLGTQTGDTLQPGVDQISLEVGDVPTFAQTPTPEGVPIATPTETSEEKGNALLLIF